MEAVMNTHESVRFLSFFSYFFFSSFCFTIRQVRFYSSLGALRFSSFYHHLAGCSAAHDQRKRL